MQKFETRKAAWIAMIIRDQLASLSQSRVQLHADGSATFRKHGALWHVTASQSEGLKVRTVHQWRPTITPEPYLIAGSAQQFAASGDEWNAHNPQFDAYRPFGQRVVQNAFGDVCNKPTIEGYDVPYISTHDQDAALARVRAEERGASRSPVEARRLCNARVAYRKGV